MEALRVEKLSKEFGGVRAVHDVSFSIQEGEHLAIIGPNGAGKTTLLNLLGGQLFPSVGKVYFFGKDITQMAIHRRAHLGIARSFQLVSLFMNLTVLDNIILALEGIEAFRYQIVRPVSSYKTLFTRAEELLNSMDIWAKKDETLHRISYGEQRKLEIAVSLASEPRLLLLDEPSCGLTATESADVVSRIRNLGSNITVILVAHDMDLVFGVAQRIMVLHYGEFIAEGTCEQIRINGRVKEIYMGMEADKKC